MAVSTSLSVVRGFGKQLLCKEENVMFRLTRRSRLNASGSSGLLNYERRNGNKSTTLQQKSHPFCSCSDGSSAAAACGNNKGDGRGDRRLLPLALKQRYNSSYSHSNHHHHHQFQFPARRRFLSSSGKDSSSNDELEDKNNNNNNNPAGLSTIDDQGSSSSAKYESFSDVPGTSKGGDRGQLAIIFTCTVCETRSAKQFTRNSYEKGVVIVRCPGCSNNHLIADNLGFFPDEEEETNRDGGVSKWNVEEFMRRQGGNVKTVSTEEDCLELTLEEITGEKE